MTFQACAMHQLFVRLCDLAHHGLYCSYVCACSHHTSLQHLPIRCLPLAIHFCGDLVRWRSRIVSARGFSSCQNVHMTGVWIHTAAPNSTTLHLALDPVTKPLTFLCFFTFAPPTLASCAASKRNKEGLSEDITNTSVCGDDVLDCDVAHQSHVIPYFSFLADHL